jgi:hypothetical protein
VFEDDQRLLICEPLEVLLFVIFVEVTESPIGTLRVMPTARALMSAGMR